MNSDKAREFFSSYFEGTLERGLKQAFERQLSTDAQVQAEYKAFEKTMKELESLTVEVPEPEFDLHDRIMQRLDQHLLDQKRKPSALLGMKLKNAIALGVCAVVLVGGALSIRYTNLANMAGFVSFGSPKISDQFSVSIRNNTPTLTFQTAGRKTVEVRMAKTDELLKQIQLDGRHYANGQVQRLELNYAADDATLLKVIVQGQETPIYIALAGRNLGREATGTGDITQMALAMSNYYQVTVVVTASLNDKLQWDFSKSTEPVSAATEALKGSQRTVDQRTAKVVWIQ